jgi:SAM-dependent methyltransferase
VSSDDYALVPLPVRVRRAARERGAAAVAGELARWAGQALGGVPRVPGGAGPRFEFQGDSFAYLYHRYKLSWLTERAVEVPIAQELVRRHAGGRVLEVGNVLSHYGPTDHLVVDKYERAEGVLNRDVLELGDVGTFDLIVAISTLEHVGWDERPRQPDKALEALEALRARLTPGGRLLLTVPVGYNPAFDAALRGGQLELGRVGALRRVGGSPAWREVAPVEVWSAPYDFLLYRANGVLIAFVER